MATSPVYAGGGRRATAPVITRTAPMMQTAQVSDDLLNQLVMGMQQYAAQQQAPTQQAAPRTQLSTNGDRSGDGNFSGGATPGTGTASLGSAARGLGAAAQVAGGVGVLSRDPGLAGIGSNLGTVAGLMGMGDKLSRAESIGDVGVAVAPMGLRALGVNAPVSGAVMGGLQTGVPGAIAGGFAGAVSMANPALGALNALSAVFGGPTIQSLVADMLGAAAKGPAGGIGFSAGDLGVNQSYGYDSPTLSLGNISPSTRGGGGDYGSSGVSGRGYGAPGTGSARGGLGGNAAGAGSAAA